MRLYDRTLWILYNHHGFGNEYQRPYATCQYGLAEEFGTSRGTIAHVICEME